MTHGDYLRKANNKTLARFLVRYCNCAVCVCKGTCPHAPGNSGHTGNQHSGDLTCAEQIEAWLGEEAAEPGA